MEGAGVSAVTAISAALLALAAGLFLGQEAYRVMRQRTYAAAAVAESRRDRIEMFLRKGCAPLRLVARRLLAYEVVSAAAEGLLLMLEQRGYAAGREPVLSLVLAGVALAGFVMGVAARSVAGGLAVSLGLLVAVLGHARSVSEKSLLAMREDVPEALRAMQTCFRAGLSLPQTLQQVSREVDGPLGERFDRAAKRLETGASTTEALAALDGGRKVPELAFVAVALDVQHQSGGSIAPVLEAARESVEGELDLLRSLRVQTAQAKLSARIVTLMPFVLVALFSLMSSDFLAPFFGSVAGMALLGLALAMQCAGVLMVRRMLRIETG